MLPRKPLPHSVSQASFRPGNRKAIMLITPEERGSLKRTTERSSCAPTGCRCGAPAAVGGAGGVTSGGLPLLLLRLPASPLELSNGPAVELCRGGWWGSTMRSPLKTSQDASNIASSRIGPGEGAEGAEEQIPSSKPLTSRPANDALRDAADCSALSLDGLRRGPAEEVRRGRAAASSCIFGPSATSFAMSFSTLASSARKLSQWAAFSSSRFWDLLPCTI
mmetsp:Transcript_38358/g.109493  ORF Transcript_38358/g.109493 Transcript_38358/m.109493 type:complete len:221 (-) Transcript_38358:321-983(-)